MGDGTSIEGPPAHAGPSTDAPPAPEGEQRASPTPTGGFVPVGGAGAPGPSAAPEEEVGSTSGDAPKPAPQVPVVIGTPVPPARPAQPQVREAGYGVSYPKGSFQLSVFLGSDPSILWVVCWGVDLS